jgi:hypothetical protein
VQIPEVKLEGKYGYLALSKMKQKYCNVIVYIKTSVEKGSALAI